MRGRFGPAPRRRNTIEMISPRADPAPLLFNAHEFGDQPFPAPLARGSGSVLRDSASSDDDDHKPREAEDVRQLRDADCPSHEFRPVGLRQAKQFANDGKWQQARISFEQVGGMPSQKGDPQALRLSPQFAAPCRRSRGVSTLRRRFSKPRMVGFVHCQHIVGERANDARDPPTQSCERPAILTQREDVSLSLSTRDAISWVVVIHTFPTIGNLTHHGPCGAQARDGLSGIARKHLAREIQMPHDRPLAASFVSSDQDGARHRRRKVELYRSSERRSCISMENRPSYSAARSARVSPGSPQSGRAEGMPVYAAPEVPCAMKWVAARTSIQVRRSNGIPCAMALRLMPRSPRRRIRLVTVAGGLKALRSPVGLATPPPA